MSYIYSKKRYERTLVFIIIGYVLAFSFLCKNLNLSESFGYGSDFLLVILLFFRVSHSKGIKAIVIRTICVLLVANGLVGILLNGVDIVNVLLGVRAQYLVFVLFFTCATRLTLNDFHRLFHYFFYFQILNLTCCLYQFFVLGYYQDLNNGAFMGGASQNFFCGALTVYYYYMYTQRKCSSWKFVFVIVSTLIIAVIEEEKFIYIELAILFIYSTVTSPFNIFRYAIAGVMILVLPYAIDFSGKINGEYSTEVLSSVDNMIQYSQQTGGGYELPRIGSSIIISDMFFHSPVESLFGIGLGNGENTTLSFANTDFLHQYGWLHYYYFTFHITLLQTGLLGIVLYLSFFISILIHAIKNRVKSTNIRYVYDMAIVITLICIATIWYNTTLRVYHGIIPFFMLALPFVAARETINKTKKHAK